MTLVGNKLSLFGVGYPLPLKNFPEGKVKIRVRNDDFTYVFIRTKESIRKFSVQQIGAEWHPLHEQASNHKR